MSTPPSGEHDGYAQLRSELREYVNVAFLIDALAELASTVDRLADEVRQLRNGNDESD